MRSHPYISALNALCIAKHTGYVQAVSAGAIEASGPLCSLGDLCEIEAVVGESNAPSKIIAQVTSVNAARTVLMPFETNAAVSLGAQVTRLVEKARAPVGNRFAGRLVDALGRPCDDGPSIHADAHAPIFGDVMPPLSRQDPQEIFPTGIRSVDAFLTMGLGQRIGIFAASGTGKTTLVSRIASHTDADRYVMCLVGERGREVQALWHDHQKDAENERLTCVSATSDQSAIMRVRAVYQALCLAEYWRDQGEHVLLVIDSITRFAMALREIGLASGQPPTIRAYTPNVFDALPRVVERCGAALSGGSITAVMTILSETDDVDDPITEVMKSLLDGHIILSRTLAELGHFPAIDVTKSVSRQAEALISSEHKVQARHMCSLLSAFDEARILIESGVYKKGTNKRVDEAIESRERLLGFLQQSTRERSTLKETLSDLAALAEGQFENA